MLARVAHVCIMGESVPAQSVFPGEIIAFRRFIMHPVYLQNCPAAGTKDFMIRPVPDLQKKIDKPLKS